MKEWLSRHRGAVLIVGMFVAFRLMWLMTALPDNLTLFGDYPYYYELAQYSDRGYWPFIHYWSEYPPVFPFLSIGIYQVARLAHGGYSAYVYLMALTMLAFSAANVILFLRLASRVSDAHSAERLGWIYSMLFVPMIYTWWNFDSMTAFFCLLAIDLFLSGHEIWSAVSTGVGAMVKLVPLLVIPMVMRTRPVKRWLLYGGVAAFVVALFAAPLLMAGGGVAWASFRSPTAWSSWETVWALLDGNLRTGLLGGTSLHFDVAQATQPVGNPARFPEAAKWAVFGALYGLIFWKSDLRQSPRRLIAFVALTFVVFFLWSKGWSPQWQLLLFPLVLLALPLRRSLLFVLVLSLVNLAEWPLLLGRGMFQSLYLTVPLRTALFVLLLIDLLGVVWASPAAVPVPARVRPDVEPGQLKS